MSNILLNVYSKGLRQILFIVLVLEEDLALVRLALNLKIVHSWLGFLFLLLFLLWSLLIFSLFLNELHYQHLIWLNEGFKEHFVIDELLPILLPMLLLDHVTLDVNEGADLVGPYVSSEVT